MENGEKAFIGLLISFLILVSLLIIDDYKIYKVITICLIILFLFTFILKINKIREEKIKNKNLKNNNSEEYYEKIIGMTGRAEFIEKISNLIKRKIIHIKKIAVVVINMDNFKNINDTYGYNFGDKVLVEIYKKIVKEFADNMELTSYGGDGLVIALPEVDDISEIKVKMENIIAEVKERVFVEEKSISCTFSAGISTYPNDSIDVEELIKMAEIAMQKAKNNGKGKCIAFDKEILKKIKRNVEVEKCLRKGIVNNEVYMVFQPKVVLKNGKIHGFEALVRWNSKELGFVSPAEFIPVAEDTGLIDILGKFILDETFKKCKQLTLETDDKFNVAINVSEVQLRDDDFIPYVSRLLDKYQIDPQYIEFEITEGTIMKSVVRNIGILLKLKELGFSIALDDFGTGYSSLNYLRRLPIDVLKIDKSFIDGIGVDEKGEKIAESIIELSHNLDLLVVAEGVETKEQLIYLDMMNCDIIQGYYFSKPESFKVIREMVINKKTF